jgi:Secretion system C-terminal sorting domain
LNKKRLLQQSIIFVIQLKIKIIMKKITLFIFLLTFSLGYSQDPATGPANPPARNAWDVKSIYNGIATPVPPQYTNVPNGTFDSFNGSTIVGDVVLGDGNTVIKYTNHLYSGIRAGSGNLDVSTMTKLHMDVYSPSTSITLLRVKLEDANGGNLELDVPGTEVSSSWNSFDLDLSTYTGVNLANLKWIVPVTYAPPGVTLYIDNVYFHRPTTSGPSPTFNPWSIPDTPTGAADFPIPPASSDSTGAITYSSSNTGVATIIGNTTIHIVGPGVTTITANQAAAAPFLAGSTSTTLTVAAPIPSAPVQPNRPAADVKSIFSDHYAPISVIGYTGDDNTYNNSWCAANTTLVQLDGNNTNKITGLGCEGITFLAGRFDATGFTRFHMDIYTETPTQDKSFNFKFSNWSGGNGETNAYEYSATNANVLTSGSEGTWISIDIPLTSFTTIGPANTTDFVQFVITSNLGTVYYDNLYLHKNTTLGTDNFEVSTVKLYPNPASNVLNIESVSTIEKVSLFNLLGQEVLSQTPNSELVTLDVASLQVGVYVVKTTIGGTVSSTRFIKE